MGWDTIYIWLRPLIPLAGSGHPEGLKTIKNTEGFMKKYCKKALKRLWCDPCPPLTVFSKTNINGRSHICTLERFLVG